jgi:hypothetical protein
MKLIFKFICVGILAIAVFAALAGITWYYRDRAAFLGGLCQAGLPNFSRPTAVRRSDLGCVILGPRQRVSGVLLTGFEASNLIDNSLPPLPRKGDVPGTTWLTCNQQSGCDEKLEEELSKQVPGLCGIRLASVVAFGWTTETPGKFGHLGLYSREFFVDQVVAVGPPPTALVKRMQREWASAGLDECDPSFR